MDEKKESDLFADNKSSEKSDKSIVSEEYNSFDIKELKKMMEEAIANEDYEKASLIKIEIDKRTNT